MQALDLAVQLLVVGFQVFDVPLLIATFLLVGRRADLKANDERVVGRVKKTFAGQCFEREEFVVAPAFSHFEVRGELADDVLRRVFAELVDHVDAVLVLRRFAQTGGQLEKDGEISAAHATVPVRVDFQTPCQTVGVKWLTVNRIDVLPTKREVGNDECIGTVRWNDFTERRDG